MDKRAQLYTATALVGIELSARQLQAIQPIKALLDAGEIDAVVFFRRSLASLEQAGCPLIRTLDKALEVLNKIEYSSDGFVKRYPEDDEYQEALNYLHSLKDEHTR